MNKLNKLFLVTALATSISGCLSGPQTAAGTGTTAAAAPAATAAPAAVAAAPAAPAPVVRVAAGGSATFESASAFPSGSCVLWKPHSEIDGGLVVLIPAAFKAPSVPVQVLRPNGEVFATGREHTQARGHNICNGTRLHYVFGRGQGSAFPMNSVLAYGGNRYKIPNPGGRYE